jgi:hypothetical protein
MCEEQMRAEPLGAEMRVPPDAPRRVARSPSMDGTAATDPEPSCTADALGADITTRALEHLRCPY